MIRKSNVAVLRAMDLYPDVPLVFEMLIGTLLFLL
jgi:hypothetical protein